MAAGTLAALAVVPAEQLRHMLMAGRYNAPLVVAVMAATIAGQLTTLTYAHHHRADLGLRWPGLRSILYGVLAGGGVIASWLAWGVIADALGLVVREQPILGLVRGLGYPVGWGIGAVVALVGPAVEEFAFRGWAQERLARWWCPRAAIMLVAGAFTLAHADTPSALPPILVLATVTGVLREKTRSTLPGLAAHLVNNAAAMGLVVGGVG